jgi:hypothetical protein
MKKLYEVGDKNKIKFLIKFKDTDNKTLYPVLYNNKSKVRFYYRKCNISKPVRMLMNKKRIENDIPLETENITIHLLDDYIPPIKKREEVKLINDYKIVVKQNYKIKNDKYERVIDYYKCYDRDKYEKIRKQDTFTINPKLDIEDQYNILENVNSMNIKTLKEYDNMYMQYINDKEIERYDKTEMDNRPFINRLYKYHNPLIDTKDKREVYKISVDDDYEDIKKLLELSIKNVIDRRQKLDINKWNEYIESVNIDKNGVGDFIMNDIYDVMEDMIKHIELQ